MRLTLLALACLGTSFGQWERYVGTPKGSNIDHPDSHPLAYFMASACVGIGPIERDRGCDGYQPAAALELLGHVGKYTIYDLNYHPSTPEQSTAESILVESEPGVFHEIYFRMQTQADAVENPAKLIDADGQTIVWASYFAGGNGGFVANRYFSFAPDGPKLMHEERLKEAADKTVLPKDSAIISAAPDTDFGNLISKLYVGPADRWRHPELGTSGTIVVHFRIDRDFVPLSVEFIPQAKRN